MSELVIVEDLREAYTRLEKERYSENGQLTVDLIERISRAEQGWKHALERWNDANDKRNALMDENAALKAENERLRYSGEVVSSALHERNEEVNELRAENERLKAPVTMEEIPVGTRIGAVRFNAIIANRAKEPKEANDV